MYEDACNSPRSYLGTRDEAARRIQKRPLERNALLIARLGVAEHAMASLEDGNVGGQHDQTESTRDARIGRRDVPIRTSAWRRLRVSATERHADDRLQRQSSVVRSDRWTVRG